MKLYAAMLVLFLCATASATSIEDCEKDNFQTCYYGIDYGTKVTTESLVPICKATGAIKETKPMLYQYGKMQRPNDKWFNSEVCVTAKGQDPIYVGNQTMRMAALSKNYAILPPAYETVNLAVLGDKNPPSADQHNATMLMPVKIDDANSRFMIVFNGMLVGYALSSIAPADLDPMYFLIDSKRKYGQPDLDRDATKEPGGIGEAIQNSVYWQAPKSVGQYLVGIAFKINGGLEVESLVKGSPAEKAGVSKSDVVVAIGDEPVKDYADFRAKVSSSSGTEMSIKVKRGTAEKVFTLKPDVNPRYGKSALLRSIHLRAVKGKNFIQSVVINVDAFGRALQEKVERNQASTGKGDQNGSKKDSNVEY